MRFDQKNKNQVKVIAGKYRGRNIYFREHKGLRPTKAILRETVFNWLAPHITEKVCLDLFAGTGVMLIEALSRGANGGIAVDNNPVSKELIQENIKTLELDLEVICQSAEDFIQSHNLSHFDIIFVDPPYEHDLSIIDVLSTAELKKGMKLILERPSINFIKEINTVSQRYDGVFKLIKQKTFGSSSCAMLEKQ